MTEGVFHIIKRVVDGIEKRANNDLKDTGLTLNQCAILGYLSTKENNTASIKNIEKAFEVSQATMQGTIQRLVKKEFIALNGEPSDRRIKNAALTTLGLDVWMQADKQRQKNEEHFFADFTQEEIETLKTLLKKLYGNII